MKYLGVLLLLKAVSADHGFSSEFNTKKDERRSRRIQLKSAQQWNVNDDIEEISDEDRKKYSIDEESTNSFMDWNIKKLSEARKNLLASIQNPNDISYTQVLPKQTKAKYVKNAVVMLRNFEKSAINRGDVPAGTEKVFLATIKGIEQLMEKTESIPNFLKLAIDRKRDANLRGANCDPGTDCGVIFDFSKIWNYGCWCYFGENAGKGKGQPQNVVDQICKNLQLCYRCVKIDSYADTEICNPANTTYEFQAQNIDGGIETTCKLSNPNNKCAYHTCCCEQDFISKMIELLWNGYIFDYSYHHSVWTTQWNTCNYHGGIHTLDCCGEYPKRRPYFSDMNMDCCDNRILYNFNRKQCCSDGTVRDQC